MGAIFKNGILYGGAPAIQAASGTHINETGTPTVTANTSQGLTTFTFDYLKGAAGASAASGVSVADTSGYFTATNVEDALAELYTDTVSKNVYLEDASSGQSSYAKVYKIYQGSDSTTLSNNRLVGTLNIPLDKVLRAASLVTQDDQGHTGHYLKLEFQNDSGVLYVDLGVLADVYQGSNGTEIAVSVANYTISASLQTGSIAKSKLSSAVQASLDKADSAATQLGGLSFSVDQNGVLQITYDDGT